jgi:hypothetical protein
VNVDLTPVVDAMARDHIDNTASPTGDPVPGAFDTLDAVQQQGVRQVMLDLLLPALPALNAQVESAVTIALRRSG